ncbi:VPLPA-CTERM sorting domain-containing protein [Halieaceae bacterium IMCC14734]|uniref:VPLPA-CTERM sorting domain-containing protein n=1 Tax=Candidatus Litorirhabdus singularis TaxID=2518993 RepID=A0ABT3TNS5_9GAMM|nr:VPLPA-CTERM sorting domain-containing protein [Candidatus Litorirhabdus singularis]MCX2983386.1 VPLPA-CTERM sorting domain-containing protein [Candidatus Litorirhabdus singularis]
MRIAKSILPISLLVLLMTASSVHAALQSRLNGQAYYDTDTNLTWTTNANIYGTPPPDSGGGGRATWYNAMVWVETLRVEGVGGWRLPISDPACYSVEELCAASEHSVLYYQTLGNSYGALVNTGPFINIQTTFRYWTGSLDPDWGDNSYGLSYFMSSGEQWRDVKAANLWMWAVQSGDVSNVPIPAAAWLFGSALIGLGALKRKKVATSAS